MMNVDIDGELVAWLALASDENFPDQINGIMPEGTNDVVMSFSVRS